MSERYTRLCVLPENLYAAGSPVLLSAGALLKDNQTGRILVQLKLRSLSPMNIKAVKVSVCPFDTVGAPLGEAVEHQYLDLTAARGDEFGAKLPIVLPDAATRAFSAVVTEVAFADNRVWHASGAPWEQLLVPQPLEQALDDAELVKQFRMTCGEDCKCLPVEYKDLWYCACGARNRREEAVCHRCGREHATLAAIDLNALRAARDARLAEEAEQAEAARIAAAAQAKKTKKITLITVTTIALIAAAVLLTTKVIIPAVKYNAAVDLMEAGQYTDAIAAFEATDGYKDSAEQITECRYLTAVDLMEARQYVNAIAAFEAMDGYKDSTDQITECKYLYAATLLESEQLNQAMSLFSALGNYKDSIDQVSECQYRGATNQMQDKNWSTAASMFQNLGSYKDSKDQLAVCRTAINDEQYDAAVKLLKAGKDWEAYDAFVALGTYKDSKTQASTILNDIYRGVLAKTVSYNDKGEYLLAYNYSNENWDDAFYQVSGYKDLLNNNVYAGICAKYEGKIVSLSSYLFDLYNYLPSTFRDVSERMELVYAATKPYIGTWVITNYNSKSYVPAVEISKTKIKTGYMTYKGEIDYHNYQYYDFYAQIEDGAVKDLRIGESGVYTIELTSAGKLKLTGHSSNYYVEEHTGTYKKYE